jgi:hypothetical protein
MKNAILILLLTAVMVVSAGAVYAGAPLSGTWKSTNGDFDEGTATTQSNGVGSLPNNYLYVPAVLYGRSYAGGVFTNDWEIACTQSVSVTPLNGFLGSTGNGNYTFLISYAGGYLNLGGPGNPWNGGDAVYSGVIDTYTEVRTVQWVNNAVVGAVSDHSVTAHIQGYPQTCVTWGIGNGVLRGGDYPYLDHSVLQFVKPANYPDFHDPNCAVVVNFPYGHWDDIRDLTLSITGCTVATEPTTWGAVKSMYRR